jgi:hypothetical protein
MAGVRHTGMMLAHFGGIDEIGILVVPGGAGHRGF